MPPGTVDRIAAMLRDEDPEKRAAAAIVLGELGAKGANVVSGLVDMLETGGPTLQRQALVALARAEAQRALPHILPLLGAKDRAVREAAVEAVVVMGEAALPAVRERIQEAGADERRAIDTVLARLGGGKAFTQLLANLADADAEEAREAAVTMRAQVRDADGRQRRGYLTQLERFLDRETKRKEPNVAAVAAAVKMLGYLEDERATQRLLSYARSKKQPGAVRQEALIALRFALAQRAAAPRVIDALVDAAESDDRALAQTALITLSGLNLPARAAARLDRLVAHRDLDRAAFAIEQLGAREGTDTAQVLVNVITDPDHDRRRAELAAKALKGREEAVPPLVQALVEADPERAWLVRNVLRPMAKAITGPQVKKLLDVGLERIARGQHHWEALLDVVREADSAKYADALRKLVPRLKRGRNPDRTITTLRLLCRSEHATDDDRYQLAAFELKTSAQDTRPAARKRDDALRLLEDLLRSGFDVARALKRDRSLGLESLYYVGFHFAEKGHPLGEELLAEVQAKGGRKKIARMAKNKLDLTAG
ncbi:MAG: HEAT repeat domain-containing protein [Myxococcota bacterium]